MGFGMARPPLSKKYWWVEPLKPESLGNWQHAGKGGKYDGPGPRVANEAGMRPLLLVVDPNGHNRMSDGTYSPISRIAEQMVTDCPGFHQMLFDGLSKRVHRQRRAAISMYLRRFFVDDTVLQASAIIFVVGRTLLQ